MPAGTSYRNASLAALFNLSPFLNLLSSVDSMGLGENIVYRELNAVATAFRTSVDGPIQNFWNRIFNNTSDAIEVNPAWSNTAANQSWATHRRGGPGNRDSGAFVEYLLNRLAFGELTNSQDESSVSGPNSDPTPDVLKPDQLDGDGQ